MSGRLSSPKRNPRPRGAGANGRPNSPIDEVTRALARERPDLDLTHMVLTLYITTLGRIIEQDFERYCTRHHRMRAADAKVLIALWRSRPAHAARPTDLFRGLYLSSGAITKQVDRLAAKRLVQRIPDPSHRGGWLVQLTSAGLKLVNGIIEDVAGGSDLCPELLGMPTKQRESVINFCFQAINAVEASPLRAELRSRSRKKASS
jgi:DNA-binding MarR family transcriptional regulator